MVVKRGRQPREALEAGINFFDTAKMYSGGSSEEIVGRGSRDMAVLRRPRSATRHARLPDGRTEDQYTGEYCGYPS